MGLRDRRWAVGPPILQGRGQRAGPRKPGLRPHQGWRSPCMAVSLENVLGGGDIKKISLKVIAVFLHYHKLRPPTQSS